MTAAVDVVGDAAAAGSVGLASLAAVDGGAGGAVLLLRRRQLGRLHDERHARHSGLPCAFDHGACGQGRCCGEVNLPFVIRSPSQKCGGLFV